MAASGFNSILLYGSTTASATPSAANLTTGASGVELAINATDGKLFYKDNLGAVQTLATKSSVISPLTANGVVYVNGSSQATSGSALTFDGSNLNIGTATSVTNRLLNVQGSAVAKPVLVQTTTTNALIEFNDSGTASKPAIGSVGDALTFWPAGSEQMRLTSTGLGIGTSSPGTKLDVNGTVRIRAGNTLYFQNAAADANGTITASGGAGSSDLAINASGGNVGIGTSSPSYKLDVVGGQRINAVSGGYLDWSYNGTVSGNIVAGNALFYVNTQTTNTIINANGGNVGIGTTSPGDKLTVSAGRIRMDQDYQIVWQNAGTNRARVYGDSGSNIIFETGSSNTEGMRLNSTGLGIGTTSPGAKLQVNGSGVNVAKLVDTSATGYSGLTLAGTGTQNYAIGMGGPSETAFSVANKFFLYDGLAGAMRMVVDSSGNVGIGSNAPTYKLVVSNAGAAGVEINPTGGISGGAFLQCYNRSTAARIPFNTIASEMYWQIDNYEKMRLDTSGNLLLGTTSVVENGIAIFAGAKTFTSGIPQYQLQAQDTTAMAAGVGGAINFTGKYTTAGAFTSFASIEASKDNATSGNFGAAMVFKTRVNGGSQTEAMRIDSSQNVGIGTSSPSEKLSVAGNISADIYKLRSNTSAPASTDAFVFRPADNTLAFGTASSERARIDSSGNLGLGVTPSAWDTTASRALQLNGGSLWGYSTSQINLMQNAYYNTAGNFVYVNTAAASGYRQISGTHRWITAASGTAGTTATFTTSMLIDGNGFLGIGTTSPSYKLHVSNGGAAGVEINPDGGINSGAFLQCYNRSTSVYVPFTTYASEMYWAISGAEKMRLDTSGNLGIGTSSPTSRFCVVGGSLAGSGSGYAVSISANLAATRLTTDASNKTGFIGSYYDDSSLEISQGSTSGYVSGIVIGARSASNATVSDALAFFTRSAERARIDGSGNLLVGTTTVFSSSKVTVQGNSTYATAILGTAGNTTSNALFIGLGGNRSTDGTYSVINYVDTDGTGTARFRVYGNGNVVNTNNSYGAISDFKLKENVTDATPKLEDLCKVRIVNYNLISDEVKEKRIGVIAQELETVFPSLVDNNPDLDVDGNFTGTSTKSVKYSAFVPMLIKAMQEQQAMIEELKARIVTLENK